MKFPRISIVVPSFNKIKYVEQTLDSIFNQKYPNLEVIIQDGGSNDGTLEIIKKYARKYSTIIRWESKKDKGQVDAINKGFKKATGDILTFLNADDLLEAKSLAKVGEVYLKHKPFWIAGYGKTVDGLNNETYPLISKYKNCLLTINSRTILLIVNYLFQPCVFFDKKAFLKYGPFRGIKGIVIEYDFWLKLMKVSKPYIIKNTIARFRLLNDSLSLDNSNNILKKDLQVVKRNSQNKFIIFLHNLHNWGRIFLSKNI